VSADLGRDLESKILTARQNEIVMCSSLLAFAVNVEHSSALHWKLNVGIWNIVLYLLHSICTPQICKIKKSKQVNYFSINDEKTKILF